MVDKTLIGRQLPSRRVRIDRSAIEHFASAVGSDNPIYHDVGEAMAAGFDAIPAPPTFAFVMAWCGGFADLQDPGTLGKDPGLEAFQALRAKEGGLILHGEQAFTYHRQIQDGDMLISDGRIVDVYEQTSKGRAMTFCVSETDWYDAETNEPVVTARFTLIHQSRRNTE